MWKILFLSLMIISTFASTDDCPGGQIETAMANHHYENCGQIAEKGLCSEMNAINAVLGGEAQCTEECAAVAAADSVCVIHYYGSKECSNKGTSVTMLMDNTCHMVQTPMGPKWINIMQNFNCNDKTSCESSTTCGNPVGACMIGPDLNGEDSGTHEDGGKVCTNPHPMMNYSYRKEENADTCAHIKTCKSKNPSITTAMKNHDYITNDGKPCENVVAMGVCSEQLAMNNHLPGEDQCVDECSGKEAAEKVCSMHYPTNDCSGFGMPVIMEFDNTCHGVQKKLASGFDTIYVNLMQNFLCADEQDCKDSTACGEPIEGGSCQLGPDHNGDAAGTHDNGGTVCTTKTLGGSYKKESVQKCQQIAQAMAAAQAAAAGTGRRRRQ